jgi:hypothetical protein
MRDVIIYGDGLLARVALELVPGFLKMADRLMSPPSDLPEAMRCMGSIRCSEGQSRSLRYRLARWRVEAELVGRKKCAVVWYEPRGLDGDQAWIPGRMTPREEEFWLSFLEATGMPGHMLTLWLNGAEERRERVWGGL